MNREQRNSLKPGQKVRIVCESERYNALRGTVTDIRRQGMAYIVALDQLINDRGHRIIEVRLSSDQVRAI